MYFYFYFFLAVWLIIIVEFCERFTFYGVNGPFQNYMEFPAPTAQDEQPGAIGAGQQVATSLSLFFSFFCYVTPILGAIIADQYFGRFKTILVFSFVYMIGLLVLTLTAIPPAIRSHASLPGLVSAMIIIGFGTGGIKSNVSPLAGDQYTRTEPYVKELANGEKVIVDPKLTIQSIFHWFYIFINIGSLSAIITTFIEKYHSFWLAYLTPFITFIFAIAILTFGNKNFVKPPPSHSSELLKFFRVIRFALVNGRNLENAKPSRLLVSRQQGQQEQQEDKLQGITWDDEYVDQVRTLLRTFKVYIFYPFYWVGYLQITNNLISQAATMQVGKIPNDVMSNVDPIIIIICTPIMNNIV